MNSVKNALELSKFVNISHVEPKNVLLFSTEPFLFLPVSSGRIDLKFDKYYYSQGISQYLENGTTGSTGFVKVLALVYICYVLCLFKCIVSGPINFYTDILSKYIKKNCLFSS